MPKIKPRLGESLHKIHYFLLNFSLKVNLSHNFHTSCIAA